MDVRFTNEYSVARLDEITAYLMGPRLWIPHGDYPDFTDWAQKVYTELKNDTKRALLALQHGVIVGATIYQRHKKYSDAVEIKNLTVRPDMQGRYIASFLLRNTEIEGAREFASRAVYCDAKAHNRAIRSFLFKHHYRALGKEDLYTLGAGDDVLYRKVLY